MINRKIHFAHIAPVSYLPFVQHYPAHLLLAHLVEENEGYRNFYVDLKKRNPSVFYHLDNSAFEMFKRGQPMYDSDKLLKMAELVKADSIVMSDYPKEHYAKTIDSALKLSPVFKDNGYQTFFCPQSELGKLDDLMESFKWALTDEYIDYIGVSILACPIALGVNEQTFLTGERDESYRLQRYLSRLTIFREMEQRGFFDGRYYTDKKFHCLGMTDGPREIELLRDYHDNIFSWDSSSAVWHGINGIRYDSSPTGLRNGKFEDEVEFDIPPPNNFDNVSSILYNMKLIDKMCEGK